MPTSALNPLAERLANKSILSVEEQQELASLPFKIVKVSPHNDFMKQLGEFKHVAMVVSGLLASFEQNIRGERQTTALHIKGSFLNLQTVVLPVVPCTIEALTNSSVVAVPKHALHSVAATHPGIAMALWHDSALENAIAQKWIANIGCQDARTRTAHLLCEMACRYQISTDENALSFELLMTQQQLAEAAGLTAVHINRTLKALSQIGTSFRQKRVIIKDWEALVSAANFNPAYLQNDLLSNFGLAHGTSGHSTFAHSSVSSELHSPEPLPLSGSV